MTVSRVAVLALVLVPVSAFDASAQNQNPGEHIVLTRIAEGFVRTNPDGTQSTTVFSVPGGQELCVFDIVYSLTGEPNSTAMFTLSNTNADGPSWRIFNDTVVLDAAGRAAGHETYKIGPKLSGNSRLSPGGTGLSGIGMTVLGTLRPGSSAPCQ